MKCKSVRRRLLLYVSGDLNRHSSSAVEKHLRECPGCQQELITVENSLAAIRQADLKERQKLPGWDENRWQELMAKISGARREEKMSSWLPARSWKKPAIVAASMAVLVAAVFLIQTRISQFKPRPVEVAASEEKATMTETRVEPALRKEAVKIDSQEKEPGPESRPVKPADRKSAGKKLLAKKEIGGTGIRETDIFPAEKGREKITEIPSDLKPGRVEMVFKLPESGIQVVWILDSEFNLRGVIK